MRLKIIAVILILSNLFLTPAMAVGENNIPVALSAPTAILVEQTTGQVLYEKESHTKMHPASVTKVMTLLLAMEAVESGKISMDDLVTCSEKVSKMEGSKVFLSKGEKISVHELIKSVAVASGNDAAVAIAEFMCGSEDGFVVLMNQRARQLGMKDTNFVNCTGLDNPEHLTTAYDIALMSRELLAHSAILDYTTIWLDSLRDGKFMLANTNRLIRYYDGANGLKTGSTSVSKYCLSASAKRNDMQLIAVLLGAPTSDERFEDAKRLLDFGFANFSVVRKENLSNHPGNLPVLKGKQDTVKVELKENFSGIVEKGAQDQIKEKITIAEDVQAPVEKNQTVGEVTYSIGGKEIGKMKIVTTEPVEKITVGYAFLKLLTAFFMMK